MRSGEIKTQQNTTAELMLAFVVKKIVPGTSQNFLDAWMSQDCKDFRIVFIDKDLSPQQRAELVAVKKYIRIHKC